MEVTCLFCNQILYPESQDNCYVCLKDRICPSCLAQAKSQSQAHSKGLSASHECDNPPQAAPEPQALD